MKELFIITSVLVLLVVIHGTEAIRGGRNGNKDRRQGQNAATHMWKRSSTHKSKHYEKLKKPSSHEKKDASQRKRQFVPGLPFLNFPHPHIHRIIVHHHPGRSIGSVVLIMKSHIRLARKK